MVDRNVIHEWLCVVFVPDHSGGSTVDFHHLPSSPSIGRTPVIACYALV